MRCSKPYVQDGRAFSCGNCTACRVQRRRVWTHRIMLEATQHVASTFLTLTYDDEHFPSDGSLDAKTATLFLKRLRKQNSTSLRYYLSGEYGETTQRPHYHAAIFGYHGCHYGVTRARSYCCPSCQQLREIWGLGNIFQGELNAQSAQYIAGYLTKKAKPPLPHQLKPFSRMSLKPGLGYGIIPDIASSLMEHKLDETLEDVPLSLQHGKRQLPLGKYLRQKLREHIGRDKKAPITAEPPQMQLVRQTAFDNSQSIRSVILKLNEGKRINLEARERRKSKGAL